ncbi:hypothetical protein ACNKHU_25410 [Shigella flexneri]
MKRASTPLSVTRKALVTLGAAVVVMAFDEQGQANTRARKIEICRRRTKRHRRGWLPARRYHLRPERLRGRENSFSGSEKPTTMRQDFIGACEDIKRKLPHALILGRRI